MAFKFVVLCAAIVFAQNASGAFLPSGYQFGDAQLINSVPSAFLPAPAFSETDTYASVSASAGPGGSSIVATGYNTDVDVSSANQGFAYNGLAGYGLSAGPLGFSNNYINAGNAILSEQPNYYFAQQLPSVLIAQPPTYFNVWSGSPVYDIPCGITIASESELDGVVSVTGTFPFAGSTWFEGTVPSEGAAALSYSTGSGAVLYDAGCGVGLGGSNGIVFQETVFPGCAAIY